MVCDSLSLLSLELFELLFRMCKWNVVTAQQTRSAFYGVRVL